MSEQLLIGAVAYHPRVVTIWEYFREYFERQGTPIDYVLYSNYERLVEATLAGEVEIGWNTNTAYVALDEKAAGETEILGMRDVDATFATVLLARKGEFGDDDSLPALGGRRLALGSRDSGHAAIMPLYYLRSEGLDLGTVELRRFDADLGTHGDTGRSELDVVRAVASGAVDAGAIGQPTLAAFRGSATPELEDLEVVWKSPDYYHCNFTALAGGSADRRRRWSEALLAMSFEESENRAAMELEGVRRWLPGDRDGYASLVAAMGEDGLPGTDGR